MSRTELQFVNQVQKNLKIESSSCLCSATSIGLRTEITMNAFRFLKKVKYFAKSSAGTWSCLGPVKKNSVERTQSQI